MYSLGVTILIVDDDPQDADSVVAALRHGGIRCATPIVSSAHEALEVLEAANGPEALPDSIILDLNLPDGEGLELLKRLQKDEVWSRLPVVVVTGSVDSRAIKRAYAAGAATFFVKPIENEEELLAGFIWSQHEHTVRQQRRCAPVLAELR